MIPPPALGRAIGGAVNLHLTVGPALSTEGLISRAAGKQVGR